MPQVLWQDQRADGNFTFDPARGDLNVGDFGPEYNEDKWYQSALAIQGKISNFDVVYSGGWFERNVHNIVDYTGYSVAYDQLAQQPGAYYNAVRYVNCTAGAPGDTPPCAGGPFTLADPVQFVNNHDKYTKFSQEFRISSPADYRFRGVFGLFYQRQTDNIRAAFQTNDLPTYYTVDGSPNTVYLSQQIRADRDYAVFTDLAFDITTQLKLSAGIRQFWVENTLYGFFGFNAGSSGEGSCNPPPSAATIIPGYWPCINTNKKVVEDGETHKVNLQYQIDPDRMVYATYSTGFRPGGNNRRPGIAPYTDDTLSNYEIGWKTSWLDRLRFNGAVFYEKWNDMQLAVTGANGITSIVNAANATVKGVESQVEWLVVDNLTLGASGTYVNARTSQNYCNADPVTEAVTHDCADPNAPAGTQLPVTPKIKANATARYHFTMGDYQNFVQGVVVHQGSSTSDLDTGLNAEEGDLSGFTTFDFSAGTGRNNWKLEAFIENAFDKRGQLGRVNQCANDYCYENYRVYPIKPMFFGVKFGQKF
jgi:iron complex outermembrane receptor protein